MINALRSEWIKVRSVRSNVVLLVLTLALPLLVTVLGGLNYQDPAQRQSMGSVSVTCDDRGNCVESPGDDPPTMSGAEVRRALDESPVISELVLQPMQVLLFALAGVFGVLIVTQEFRFGTIRTTFAANPRRLQVLGAKGVVVGLTALALSVVFVVVGTAVTKLIVGDPVRFDAPELGRLAVGSVVWVVLAALWGLGVGAVVRHPGGAIAAVLIWPTVAEGIVSGLWDSGGRWLPFRAGSSMFQPAGAGSSDALSPALGGGLMLLWVAVILGVGATLLVRRDA